MLKTTKIWNWHGAKVKIWIGAAFAISTGITGEFKNDFSSPKTLFSYSFDTKNG